MGGRWSNFEVDVVNSGFGWTTTFVIYTFVANIFVDKFVELLL